MTSAILPVPPNRASTASRSADHVAVLTAPQLISELLPIRLSVPSIVSDLQSVINGKSAKFRKGDSK